MKKIYISILALLIILINSTNSHSTQVWSKTYGGTGLDVVSSIQQSSDKGYILTGYTNSFGAGEYDILIIKLNSNGKVSWQKTYGGTGDDFIDSTQEITDEEFILAGSTDSFNDGTENIFFIMKLDKNGTPTSQKIYHSGVSDRYAFSIQQTSDEGYILGGEINSFDDFYTTDSYGWLMKLDNDFNVSWQKIFGMGNHYIINYINQTSDEGYILAGNFKDCILDCPSNSFLLKIDNKGETLWEKLYSLTFDSVQENKNGGYIVAGTIFERNSGLYNDISIASLDEQGNILWEKIYGGINDDELASIQQTKDGGYIAVSNTYSEDSNIWILKLNVNGKSTACSTIGKSQVIPNNFNLSEKQLLVTNESVSFTISETDAVPKNSSVKVKNFHGLGQCLNDAIFDWR